MTLAEAIQKARAEGVTAHEAGAWLDANPYILDRSQSPADYVRTNAEQRAWRRGWLSVGSPLDNLDIRVRVAFGIAPSGDMTLEQYHQLQMLERGDATKVAR